MTTEATPWPMLVSFNNQAELDAFCGHKSVSNKLPMVLTFKPPQSSISVERALKQARELIEEITAMAPHHEDRIQATLDDLDMMISAVRAA